MPVPFAPEVTTYAVELLAGSSGEAGDAVDPFDLLKRRFPRLHPVLIAEHLQYAEALFQSASSEAAMIRVGTLTQEQALDSLRARHPLFSSQSVAQALAYVQASA